MSENEKRLRQMTCLSREASEALDALLAEHCAEVEKLTEEKAEAERFRDAWRRRWSEDVGATRDAALEEAARLLQDEPSAAVRGMADVIRALKSQPARQYVDAEKVREVLREMWPGGNHSAVVLEFCHRLSVDLNAKAERTCAGACLSCGGHLSRDNRCVLCCDTQGACVCKVSP